MLHLGSWMGFTIWFESSLVFARLLYGPKVSSWKEAEAWVILSVVREAKVWGFHKIHLFYDALEVVRVINGSLDCTIHSILTNFKEMFVNLDVIVFAHIPKSLNCFAHNLTNNSYRMGNFVGWVGSRLRLLGGICFNLLFPVVTFFVVFVPNESLLG